MIFWTSALQVAAKMDRLKLAETKLLLLAREFGDRNAYEYKITTMDTSIPRKVVPLKPSGVLCGTTSGSGGETGVDEEDLTIHAVRVESQSSSSKSKTTKTPLVLLHGYMNASAYFYRNLVGLSHYFENIYSLDMLGWGLSSRPTFDLLTEVNNNSHEAGTELQQPQTSEDHHRVSMAEQFFVESLEAWRERNGIEKMILAGHSMGGYMSVAYCEKYPERVERLILLSPVGVPEESEQDKARRESMRQASWRYWALSGLAQNVFHYHNPAKVFRSMPTSWGESMVKSYVQKRLPAISDPEEQHAIAEYLMANNALPGSGEHCLSSVLNPFAFAKRPMEYRIPRLKVKSVTFLYGAVDWMNPKGGLAVQKECQARRLAQQVTLTPPDVSVYQISQAGHLLMLDNWKEFNSGVILAAGGSLDCLPPNAPVPTVLTPEELVEDQQKEKQRQQQRSSAASLSSGVSASGPQIASN